MNPKANYLYRKSALVVNRAYQKQLFQIHHPEDTFVLSGILPLVRFANGKESTRLGTQMGVLKIAIAESGDVAYTTTVEKDPNVFTDRSEVFIPPYNAFPSFSFSGKRYTYFETQLLITQAIAEGYYEDTFQPSLTLPDTGAEAAPVPSPFVPYQVHLYLRYEHYKPNA